MELITSIIRNLVNELISCSSMWQQPQFFQQPGYYPDQFGGPPQEFPPQFVQAGDPRQPPPPYYPLLPRQYPRGAQQPEVNIYQNTDQNQAKRKNNQ